MCVEGTADVRHADRDALREHLGEQRDVLAEREIWVPEVYVSVRLGRSGDWRAAVRRLLPPARRTAIGRERLEALLAAERETGALLARIAGARPVEPAELQWLIRRAFCRGLGEPAIDERFLPQALVVPGEQGARYRPLSSDVLRLMDAPVNVEKRSLRIETEAGDSHQALLCAGALPEVVAFPGAQAELLFAPLEAVGFPVDAALSARPVARGEAVRLVRRRVVAVAEDDDEPLPLHPAADLAGADEPPLVRASISFCVGAAGAAELEERVAALRRAVGRVALHRPLGDQLALFFGHMPGGRARVAQYDDYVTVEQVGAMAPLAAAALGTERGPCVGTAVGGAARPVRLELPPGGVVVLAGAAGRGKSVALQLLTHQALLSGARVCVVDLRGTYAPLSDEGEALVLRAPGVVLPEPGLPRGDQLAAERAGREALQQAVEDGLAFAAGDPGRRAVLGVEDAGVLLGDAAGRALVSELCRHAAAAGVAVLLSSRLPHGLPELDAAALCFGMRGEAQALAAARQLLRAEEPEALVGELLALPPGVCFLRDFAGRIGPVRLDFAAPSLVARACGRVTASR
jgi:hypothetical protein